MAINFFTESQAWLLKFVSETSPTLSDSQKKAISGQIEFATGILELVRQQLNEWPPDEPLPLAAA